MNIANFIFRLLHIHNLPTLIVLTPPCSPHTPSANFAHLFIDYVNSFDDCDNTSTNYTNFFTDCANTSVDSADTCVKSSLDLYIPNPSPLQLLFIDFLVICRSKINIMLTVRSSFYSSSFVFCIYGFCISQFSSSSCVSEFFT